MAKKTAVASAVGGSVPRGPSTRRVRKNMDMDARKLAEARRILGARTETEAVDQALDLVIFQDRVLSAIDRLAAAGGIDDIYAGETAVAPPGSARRGGRRRTASR